MRRFQNVLCLAVLASAWLLRAQEEPTWLSWSASVTLKNRHIHRGSLDNAGPTTEASFSLQFADLQIDTDSVFRTGGMQPTACLETETVASWGRRFRKVEFRGGVLHRRMPNAPVGQPSNTNEALIQVSAGRKWPLSYTLVRDLGSGRGWYHDASVWRYIPVRRNFGLLVSAGAGLNQHLFMSQTAISDGRLQAGAVLVTRSGVELIPYYQASIGHRSLFGHHHTVGIAITARGRR